MRGRCIAIAPAIAPALVAVGALCAVTTLAACASSDDYVIVTVDAHPAVHDATSITVSLSNAGTTRMDKLELHGHAFPVTFSIAAAGRSGDLAIAVDATSEAGLLVGHTSATTSFAANRVTLTLDATDFVVNTDYAGDQFPSSDFEAAGFQLAALPDGTWTVAFRDGCPSNSCNLFARRFDKTGVPTTTLAAAGTNAFQLNARPTTLGSTPAIAANKATTVGVWDFFDPSPATTSGVACRAIDAGGALGADQTTLATDAADVVSIAAMSNENFAVSWKTVLNVGADLDDTIRLVMIKPDCTPATAVVNVAQGGPIDIVHRGSVASSGDKVLLAWITHGDLHTRMASNTGVLAPEATLVPQTATDQVEHARIAALPDGGFAVAVRWTLKTATTGPGRIDLFRINAAGVRLAAPVQVTDKSGSDFDSSESFGLASRPDGLVMVAWHSCGAAGDDSMCGVFGKTLRATSPPDTDGFATVLDTFVIPTTTLADQKLPSVIGLPGAFVAVWSDASAKPPDLAGQSVRARILPAP